MQLVLEHSDRFRDENGHPLPFVQELSEYVSKANDEIVAGKRGTYGHAAKLRNEFNARTKPLLGKTFKSKDGHTVEFTQDSQDKIRSSTQQTKENGFTVEEHFEAANQIKHLFESASLVKWHDDYKHGDKNLKIGRFLSGEITLNSGKEARVCITVKHTLDKNKKAIYSIEGMEITDALAKTRAKGYGRHLEGTSSPLGNVSQTGGTVKQKTLNAAQIMQAGKNGEWVRYEDIDWDALEKDKGKARQAITKKNIFGNVDWDALKAGGMKGGAGFLISRIYDCIEDEPMRDSPEARRGYVGGINELRDMLESAKTAQDVQNALEKIKKEIRGDTSDINVKGTAEYKERKAKADALEREWEVAYQKAQELDARREYEKAEKARKKEYRLRDAANAAGHELDDWEREQKASEKKQRRDKWWYLGVDFHALFDDNARLRKEIGKQLNQAAKGKWNSWSWLKDSKTAGKNGAVNDEEEPEWVPF